MDQLSLLFIVSTLTGVFSSRWALRLAPATNELPLKIMLATLLSGVLAARAFVGYALPALLVVGVGLAASLYVYSPIFLTGLARARRYGLAHGLSGLLFWSSEGRHAVRRLLAQVALQQGDTARVLELISERDADPLLLAQLYAAEEKWPSVLTLELSNQAGDNVALGLAARIEALLALGKQQQAEAELEQLRERFKTQQGALTYRSLNLSEARVAAEQGNLRKVQELLNGPAEGNPPYQLFSLAARAAEQAGNPDNAIRLYKQAYAVAPGSQRERYAAKLAQYNEPLPELSEKKQRVVATLTLAGVLALAYGVQAWLSNTYSLASAGGSLALLEQSGLSSGQALGSFTLNIPQIPEAGALWRYLSYGFLHGGIVHLGFNLWVLFDIGRLYEARRGAGNLLTAFVFGTVLGAYLTSLAQANEVLILVGASGGILGIAGALLADTWRGTTLADKAMTRSLSQWMVIIVLFSFAIPGVSLWGHVGGVVGGLLWGFMRQGLPKSGTIDTVAGGLSIVLMLYALGSMAALFFHIY